MGIFKMYFINLPCQFLASGTTTDTECLRSTNPLIYASVSRSVLSSFVPALIITSIFFISL